MENNLSFFKIAPRHYINYELKFSVFKALLFLSAGSVIHSMSDQQDIRRLGGLINFLPFTYTIMLIGSLSLLATPWLTGFYSKDLIIELGYAQYGFSGYFAYILGSLTAGLTAFYSFRLISLTFLTYPNAKRIDYLNSHEASISVVIPLTILALFSIFFGFLFSDLFVGVGSDFLSNSIFIHPNHITLIEAEFSLPILIKLLPALLSLLGAITGIFLYHNTHTPYFIISFFPEVKKSLNNTETEGYASSPTPKTSFFFGVAGRTVYTFLNSKFLFDVLYNKYIISGGLKLGYTISKILDKGVIEIVGPHGLSSIITNTGLNVAKLDTGVVTTYSLYICLGLLSLLFLVFAPLLLDTSLLSEIRLFIIYLSSLVLVFKTSAKKTNEYIW
jgi:NADH-ubiquinone oxidoreductase chain 5